MDALQVARLRQETGAGVMDCKRALQESGGDPAQAKEILRRKGLECAAAKQGQETRVARIGVYLHGDGVGAGIVELSCETDFVAKNQEFQDLLRELAIAVYAFSPVALTKDDLPQEMVEEVKKRFQDDLRGKPPAIAAQILDGKLEKNLYSQKCLLHIPFRIEEKFKGTYGEFLKSKVAILKENIVIRRYQRLQAGA